MLRLNYSHLNFMPILFRVRRADLFLENPRILEFVVPDHRYGELRVELQ